MDGWMSKRMNGGMSERVDEKVKSTMCGVKGWMSKRMDEQKNG